MGDVDRADENVDKYWASICGNKMVFKPYFILF